MATPPKTLDRNGFMKRFSFKDVSLLDGSTVRIRALPASYVVDGAEDRFSPMKLLVHSLCDEDGALLFAEHEADLAMLVDSASLKIILDAVLELNGLKRDQDLERERPTGRGAERHAHDSAGSVEPRRASELSTCAASESERPTGRGAERQGYGAPEKN